VTKVLVVDDEPQIVRALTINLTARAYEVVSAATGRQALAMAASTLPDIVVLDLGLPDLDGIDVVRGLRGWSQVPIIILSGRNQSPAKVAALDAGADDYVTKPFNVDELLARLRAVTRRTPTAYDDLRVEIGDLTVDLLNHRIFPTRVAGIGGAERRKEAEAPDGSSDVHLTRTEWQLLEALIRHPGKLTTQRELLRAINRTNYADESHYLRQFMNQLRRKLEPDPSRPRHLKIEPGMGYRFQP
jgi:two-component system KDP operon response regulator KdpE